MHIGLRVRAAAQERKIRGDADFRINLSGMILG
jgi:hypothetical protein